jgi:hypothetical protein
MKFKIIKAYFEICSQVQNVVFDTNLRVPHGTVSGQTAFYDNKQSIAEKVNKNDFKRLILIR